VHCKRLGRDGEPVSDEEQVTVTDGAGSFSFKGLEAGSYRLSATGSGEGESIVEVRPGRDAEGVVLEVRRNS